MTISRDKFQQITNSRYGIELQHTSGNLKIRPVSSSERIEIESDVYPDFDMTPNQLRSFLNSIGQECDWNERISIEFLHTISSVIISSCGDVEIDRFKFLFRTDNNSLEYIVNGKCLLSFVYIKDLVLFFQSQRIELEF